ncbi:GNAT family N-acetyltransferase, partial [Paenibacillus sp. OT2-17]|nr:GNAT family N-acetyltransferase [Paenibacillus sp. OT2-17]
LAQASGQQLQGMFAEIYDPYRGNEHSFGGVKPMDPYVRREVLSHLGYKRLDLDYVHPSWNNDGVAVEGLNLGFMPEDDSVEEVSAKLVAAFIRRYYTVLPNKPAVWNEMVDGLEAKSTVALLPL